MRLNRADIEKLEPNARPCEYCHLDIHVHSWVYIDVNGDVTWCNVAADRVDKKRKETEEKEAEETEEKETENERTKTDD